ncbi:MAG: hypothetical protein WC829_20500 [Hyphomicrobium sp.]
MGPAKHCRKDGATANGQRRGYLFEVVEFIGRAGAVARERRALMRLGDSALKDFGASRADAWNEASKPWWDLPERR